MYRRLLLLFLPGFFCLSSNAQTPSDTSLIRISGKAVEDENPAIHLEDLMIVNLAVQQGTFGKADGTFSVTIRKMDTLLIASTGYEFKKICFIDSVLKDEYNILVRL